ncbi:Endonuclease, Uma2 family (restriction endonuclease fold) [Thermomonospora echinospora]|uniref:Endonuclease, Uma2 family (Restriction endonuclease fold) n=1 Tax=Thermomonospora echinospora TaxID=1992 RepID=A0A1H5VPW6_9ACTN|nr:Uma2 family endonuclease [Thermomonospora echinospora]SEF88988.1 Endonuclease, Uma2 family (restriction endonuclease fold) [Thermomonospora echinospora]
MTLQIDLPSDGVITRATFEGLPATPRGWAWELRDGRLELVHMPVTFWYWQVIMTVLQHWRRLGHEVAGEQYVADSGFARGRSGRNNFVADGVVFVAGHRPEPRETTHDASVIHLVVEAVSERSEENDAVDKFDVYAKLGIEHYWIVRGGADMGDSTEIDGMVAMHQLKDGAYEVVAHRMLSRLDG